MKKMIRRLIFICISIITIIPLYSCSGDTAGKITSGNEIPGNSNVETNTDEIPDDLSLYIVVSVDTTASKIIVETIGEDKKLVLTYNGATSILNRYNKEISIQKLKIGEIVEIQYKRGTQKLTQIKASDKAWEYTQVKQFTIDLESSKLVTGNQNYSISDETMAFSNNLQIAMSEINEVDEITLKGYGTKIYSVIVTKGHGYIVLENTESFVGGMIDIGSEIITEIENNMVITAPEGTYTLTVTKSGAGGSQEIVVLRDVELTVDISRLQTPLEMGSAKFNITPTNAKLYVDGNYVLYTDPISLSYGNHLFRITASGYNTIIGKISINKAYTSQTFAMNVSQTTTASQTTTTSAGKQKITVSAPTGVDVYFDNANKGTTPVSFDAVTGTHTILLRKTGYLSKSYSVNIPDDGKDVALSFDDLVAAY